MEGGLEKIETNNGWEISLQGELISEWLEENELENTIENKMRWTENYSKKYREIIEENPQFTQEYMTDKDGLKEKIKNLLYQEIIH